MPKLFTMMSMTRESGPVHQTCHSAESENHTVTERSVGRSDLAEIRTWISMPNELLQDMSSFYAPSRPSMATALQRLVRLRAQLPQDKSLMLVRGLEPRYIPRHFLRHVHEIYRARGLSTVALFTYGTIKNG